MLLELFLDVNYDGEDLQTNKTCDMLKDIKYTPDQ